MINELVPIYLPGKWVPVVLPQNIEPHIFCLSDPNLTQTPTLTITLTLTKLTVVDQDVNGAKSLG